MTVVKPFAHLHQSLCRRFRHVLYTCLLVWLTWFTGTLYSGPEDADSIRAPAIQDCRSKESRDLGLWDDIIACKEHGLLVLRRGEDLFSLPMAGNGDPVKTSSVVGINQGHFSSCVACGNKLWVMLSRDDGDPCIVDAKSGFVSTFHVPGIAAGKKPLPSIQSFVIIPQAEAAFVEVSGGNPATWPRDGNRPVYFWVSLKSGQTKNFPVGWDLSHFTSDQSFAVFAKQETDRTGRRLLQGVDPPTGAFKDEAPNQYASGGTVPYDRGYTRLVKPVYLRREATGGVDFFSGLSFGGKSFPSHLELKEEDYLSKAEAGDGYAGFKLRHSGEVPISPAPFYTLRLDGRSPATLVANQVADFAILAGGQCVFTSSHGERGKTSTETYFVNVDDSKWNILDGVERLPELEKALANKPYIEDGMTVRLVEGLDEDEAETIVACIFTHNRRDMRSFVMGQSTDQPTVKAATWRRTIIVTPKGRRYLTDLFRDEYPPDHLWLNRNGRIITGMDTWVSKEGSSDERVKKVRLHELILPLE